MTSDPLAHLRARLNAIGELMTRVAKDGQVMRSQRDTASEFSRHPDGASHPEGRPRTSKREKSPVALPTGMRLEARRGNQRRKSE